MTAKKLTRHELNFLTSLQKRQQRYEQKLFLIEGTHLVKEALQQDYPLHEIFFYQNHMTKDTYQLIEKAEKKNIHLRPVDSYCLERISTTKTPQPVVAIAPLPETNYPVTGSALYFYKINDPGNLGTIMRTALWYGIDHLILSPESCDPFNTKTVRASQGAIFSIRLTCDRDISTLVSLAENYQILVSDPNEKNFPYVEDKFITIFGSESQGMKNIECVFKHQRFGIKRKGAGESLNLAVAVGIFLDRVRGD
jgi:TrmH family RNA methyltransferase